MPPQKQDQVKSGRSTGSVVSFIERMAEEGYATFATNNKRPLLPGENWKNSEVDSFPSEVSYPRGEYGVVLRPDDLIVDIDPRNFPEGRKCWSEFCAEFKIPSLLKTRIVQTGSGGMHIYLKKPAAFSVRKTMPNKTYPGLDFLSAGNYIIGPGSAVPDSNYNEYKIIADYKIAAAPMELLNVLIKAPKDFTEKTTEIFRDTPENISRFIEFLKTAETAEQGKSGDLTTYKTACRGRDYGLSAPVCCEVMTNHWNTRCVPPWNERDLMNKVFNAYRYNDAPIGTRDPFVVLPDLDKEQDEKKWILQIDVTAKGDYKNTFKNCVLFLTHDKNLKGKFAFNQFSYRVELMGTLPWEKRRVNFYREINDLEVGHIALYLAQTYHVEFATPKVWEALAIAAAESNHHPIKEWLEGLKWDGVERLGNWLVTYCGAADTQYARAIGLKTLTAAVGRIYRPGIKFDTVLILEGAQGVGKSTACAILGGKWFGDAQIDVHNMKDTIEYVHSHWIIEFSEMAATRKADVNKLKNFLSSCEDDARPAYARSRIRFPRQSIFIGTVNPDSVGYLSDDTGNRRFWPVLCENFNTKKLREDRDQIFAEAVKRFKAGEELYLDYDLTRTANVVAMERLIKDPWTEIVKAYVNANPEIDIISTSDLYTKVIGGRSTELTTGHARRLANALVNCGFTLRKGPINKYVRGVVVGEFAEAETNPFEVKP